MKKTYRIIPFILCAAMALTPAAALAEEANPSASPSASATASPGSSPSAGPSASPAASPVTKDESVYCILNPDGSLKEQTVSCWLHADGGVRSVTDQSDLADIKNVKSDTQPKIDGGSVKWDSDETDIYYTGSSSETPPLSAEITYQLNGQDIAAKDLVGKSGQVTIQIHLTNNQSEEKTIGGMARKIYTPIAAAVVIDLPVKNFKNVQAGDSQIITESTNQVVTFVSMPGLKENFDGVMTDELSGLMDKVGDTLTVTAQAEDFSMPTIAVAAATSLADLKEINLDDKVNKLTDGLSQLTDATSDLRDGTDKLSDAINTFDTKMTDLKTNYDSFNSGVASALDGAKKLQDGTAKLNAAAATLKDTVNGQLIPGITGSSALENQLKTKMTALQKQLAGLKLPDTTKLQNDLAAAYGSVYSDAVGHTISVLAADGKLTGDVSAEVSVIGNDAPSVISHDAAVAAVTGDFSGMSGSLGALSTLNASLTDISSLSSQLMGSMDVLTGSLYNPNDKDLTNPKTLANAIIALSMGADSVNSGASDLKNGVSILSDASAKIEDAIAQFKNGTATLSEKTGELSSGMKEFQQDGVDQINKDNLTSDLDTAMQIKDAMQQQADAFTSYSGAPEGVKNSIRFIMKTDGIEEQKTTDVQPPQTQKEESVWDKISDFFKGIFNKK